MALAGATVALLALWGCSTPRPGGASNLPNPSGRDGPEAHPPAHLDSVPNAQPQVESIRRGGPNKPYEVAGQTYVPMADDKPLVERGLASWYGRKFHGQRTASGELYNMYAMTAAHKTMPIPSYARVRNPANGREVIVRVNDRGPFSKGRVIDLSYTAALKLGLLGGVGDVEVERITYDDIRTGRWMNDSDRALARNAASPGEPAAQALAFMAGRPPPDAAGRPSGADAPPAATDVVPSVGTLPVPGGMATVQTIGPTPEAAPNAAPHSAPNAMPPAGVVTLAGTADAASLVNGAADAAHPDIDPTPLPKMHAYTDAAAGFWLQLGAFRKGAGAYEFQQKVGEQIAWLAPMLTVFADQGLHRLQAGPFETREQAQQASERVRTALQLVPVVIERR
jgi:rare lipoprotein A